MIECKEKFEILKKLNFLKQPSNTPIVSDTQHMLISQ